MGLVGKVPPIRITAAKGKFSYLPFLVFLLCLYIVQFSWCNVAISDNINRVLIVRLLYLAYGCALFELDFHSVTCTCFIMIVTEKGPLLNKFLRKCYMTYEMCERTTRPLGK